MKLKKYLENLIAMTGPSGLGYPSNHVGTRRKRWRDDKDSFITDVPGKKKKKKKKKSLLDRYFPIQGRRIPEMRSGKAIFVPQFEEE